MMVLSIIAYSLSASTDNRARMAVHTQPLPFRFGQTAPTGCRRAFRSPPSFGSMTT
jgi:hypothetical protein